MNYRLIDHTSKPFLATYLRSIYELSNDGTEHIYGCVPNGEIGISVIVSGESHTQTINGWIKQPPISVYGLVKKVEFHRMSANYHEINLGFSPHFLQLFLKDNLHALSKTEATPLDDLVNKKGGDLLFERFMQGKSDNDLLESVEYFLRCNLLREVVDKRVLVAQELIANKKQWNVAALSAELNISSTALRNLFKEQVGISPKECIKIHRIKQALDFRAHGESSLTQLAYHLQYFDQAHFIHDFKESIGLTPKQYFSNTKLTFDFYNFQRWSYDSFAP